MQKQILQLGSTLAIASDEALVISAKAGMHLAYAELCRRHSTLIASQFLFCRFDTDALMLSVAKSTRRFCTSGRRRAKYENKITMANATMSMTETA